MAVADMRDSGGSGGSRGWGDGFDGGRVGGDDEVDGGGLVMPGELLAQVSDRVGIPEELPAAE